MTDFDDILDRAYDISLVLDNDARWSAPGGVLPKLFDKEGNIHLLHTKIKWFIDQLVQEDADIYGYLQDRLGKGPTANAVIEQLRADWMQSWEEGCYR